MKLPSNPPVVSAARPAVAGRSVGWLGTLKRWLGGLVAGRRDLARLQALVEAADRLAAGDHGTPVAIVPGPDDELGRLAQALERLRAGVDHRQAQWQRLAHCDALTGLPNQVRLRHALHDAIAAAQAHGEADATVSLVVLDLHRFRSINAALGRRVGDLLLVAVAQRLAQQVVRGADLVARLGGDRFALLLCEGGLQAALGVARRVERAFEAPLSVEQHSVDLGAAIGIACWPHHAGDADTLLSRAELALQAGQRAARGPCVYDPAHEAARAQSLALLDELQRALAEGQLQLHLQPQLALDSAAVVGAEALLRWQHPQRGLLAPRQFLQVAEQAGLIRTLTPWAFEEAARHWQRLHGAGLSTRLSVNLSARALLDPDLPLTLDGLLVRHRVPAEAFCLALPESALALDAQRVPAMLHRLSALGFRLAIDHVGSGASPLVLLKRLPVDQLRIDKRLVTRMDSDADDAKIVRSLIALGHQLGLSVLAAGVQSARVWEMLREFHCDHAQGDHMGAAMPVDEFAPWNAGWALRQQPPGPLGRVVLH